MAHLERGEPHRPQLQRAAVDVLDDLDGEAALHLTRTGIQRLHRSLEARRRPSRPDDGEVPGAPAELPVEHEEGQPAEVVTVEVADEHRLDLVRVDVLLPEPGEVGSAAVEEHAGRCFRIDSKRDAGLSRPPEPKASPLPTVVTRIAPS